MMQVINTLPTMTPEQFVYWLQGFMEMADPQTLTEAQVKMLKEHLALVFAKKTNTLADLTIKDFQVPYQEHPAQMPPYVMPQPQTVDPMPKPPYTVTCSTHPVGEKPSVFIC
jgi:hypothetical protein